MTIRSDFAHYLQEVYGEHNTSLAPTDLNVLYTSALLRNRSAARFIMSGANSFLNPCWRQSGSGDRPCGSRPAFAYAYLESLGRRNFTEDLILYNTRFIPPTASRQPLWNHSDGSWVEVTRWASKCALHPSVMRCDGRQPARMSRGGQKTGPWTYGCWFFLVGRGTVVYVNVGRSMRFQSRAHLSRHFGLQDRFSNYYQPDFEWCKHALKLGYDSILVGSENSSTWRPQSRLGELPEHSQAELVICSGQCNDRRPDIEIPTPLRLSVTRGATRVLSSSSSSSSVDASSSGPSSCGPAGGSSSRGKKELGVTRLIAAQRRSAVTTTRRPPRMRTSPSGKGSCASKLPTSSSTQ